MPEGDTLHRLAGKLGPALLGKTVESLELTRLAHDTRPFVGSTIERIEARGKYLCIHFSIGRVLVTHLGMLGRWRLGPRTTGPVRVPNLVVVLRTATHEATCAHAPEVRLLACDRLHADRGLGSLGPDVLGDGFDAAVGARRLRSSAAPIGVALLDQRLVAGIGNVWKSELCFLERIDPRIPAHELDEAKLVSLLVRARELMARAVDRGGPRSTRGFVRRGESPLHVYERAGKACRSCAGPITLIRQGEGARSTYLCERCQAGRGRPVENGGGP